MSEKNSISQYLNNYIPKSSYRYFFIQVNILNSI